MAEPRFRTREEYEQWKASQGLAPDVAAASPAPQSPAPEAAAEPLATLMNCPDCNQGVSIRAVTCPHCGAPLRPAAKLPSPSADAWVFAILCVVLTVIAAVTYESTPTLAILLCFAAALFAVGFALATRLDKILRAISVLRE
jgi:hypothetical protein